MLKSKRRFIALITALAMAAAMVFSVMYVAHSAKHECCRTDCQICAHINACLRYFDNTTPKPAAVFSFTAAVFAAVLTVGVLLAAKNIKTLISLKVKLSI